MGTRSVRRHWIVRVLREQREQEEEEEEAAAGLRSTSPRWT
jgi:hypothetical protein